VTPGAQESYEQGLYYLEKWDLDKAEEALREVIELEPNHARAWNKLGVLFARREDLRQAEECFEEALRLDSHFADPYSNLGNIYAERGWTDRAKTAYEKALVLDPGNPAATHNLGVLYRKMGQIGKGVDLLKQANRAQRSRFRRDVRTSPEARRTVRIGWAVIALIAIVLFWLLNR